jgi:predicted NUDIX family NTP pyrophosphohydrolase
MDPTHIKSNDFEMEWPPKSGRKQSFPEIDRAEWFSVEAAKEKINPKQAALIDELISIVSGGRAG